jgi:hypothetical protein
MPRATPSTLRRAVACRNAGATEMYVVTGVRGVRSAREIAPVVFRVL